MKTIFWQYLLIILYWVIHDWHSLKSPASAKYILFPFNSSNLNLTLALTVAGNRNLTRAGELTLVFKYGFKTERSSLVYCPGVEKGKETRTCNSWFYWLHIQYISCRGGPVAWSWRVLQGVRMWSAGFLFIKESSNKISHIETWQKWQNRKTIKIPQNA